MPVQNIVLPIPLSAIDSADFSGAFQILSAANGIPNACFLIRITNNSTIPITISYDGKNDHDWLASLGVLQLNFGTNAPSGYIANLRQSTKIYVLGLTTGTGLVYLAGWYQPQGV